MVGGVKGLKRVQRDNCSKGGQEFRGGGYSRKGRKSNWGSLSDEKCNEDQNVTNQLKWNLSLGREACQKENETEKSTRDDWLTLKHTKRHPEHFQGENERKKEKTTIEKNQKNKK